MDENFQLTVKYKKIFPIASFSVSFFILCLHAMLGFTASTLLGTTFLMLSVLMWLQPIAVITLDSFHLMNLLGMTIMIYFYLPDDITVTNSTVEWDDKRLISTFWADVDLKEYKEKLIQLQEQYDREDAEDEIY